MSRSARSIASWESYGMPIVNRRSAQPMMPRPIRRLAFTVSSMIGSGYGFISMTSSRKRTASRTTRSISSQSIDHSPASLLRANFETLSEPRLHASLGKSGCSPHGFVASTTPIAGVGFAGLALIRSMKTIPGAPGGSDDAIEDLFRQQPARDRAAVRVDQVVLAARRERVHEAVGHRHGDVEVGDAAVELAVDELEDVRVIDPEDPHVRPAARSALLHRLGRAVEDFQEGHGARRAAAGRRDDVVLRAQPREREPRPAARLVDDRRR